MWYSRWYLTNVLIPFQQIWIVFCWCLYQARVGDFPSIEPFKEKIALHLIVIFETDFALNIWKHFTTSLMGFTNKSDYLIVSYTHGKNNINPNALGFFVPVQAQWVREATVSSILLPPPDPGGPTVVGRPSLFLSVTSFSTSFPPRPYTYELLLLTNKCQINT